MRAPGLRDVARQLAQQRRDAIAERERYAAAPWSLGLPPDLTGGAAAGVTGGVTGAPTGAATGPASAAGGHSLPGDVPEDLHQEGPGDRTGDRTDDRAGGGPAEGPLDAEHAGPDGTRSRPDGAPLFGRPGPPISRSHPFVIGFLGATGALVAWFLLGLLTQLTAVLTLVVIALFLALALDPLIRFLQRRGVRRGPAVGLVFLGVVGLFVAFGFAVVPPLVGEATDLSGELPGWLESLQQTEWVINLDQRFEVVSTLTEQLQTQLSSGNTIMQLFGGVLGAGQAVLSGAFSTFTVLVLTLYFSAYLNTLREAVYALVPASRRTRVRLLGDEVIRRIGGYILGQIAVAAINATFTYLGLTLLGLPFALVLAISVGLLGLIPLVGATLGAVVVTTVALFQGWNYAVAVVTYYLVYQQVENYLIAPKIMARTVKVPGFLAVVAALAGATLLGVVGALIAIPVAASILLVIQEVLIPRQQRS